MASGFVFMLYITFYSSAIPFCYPTAHCLTIISFMGLILKLPFSSLSSTEYAFQMKVQRIECIMLLEVLFFNYILLSLIFLQIYCLLAALLINFSIGLFCFSGLLHCLAYFKLAYIMNKLRFLFCLEFRFKYLMKMLLL